MADDPKAEAPEAPEAPKAKRAEFPARRAEAGQEFGYTRAVDGKQMRLKADAAGLIRARNQEEEDVLNAFDLPVARKAKE